LKTCIGRGLRAPWDGGEQERKDREYEEPGKLATVHLR
jgi:hypothetical protein